MPQSMRSQRVGHDQATEQQKRQALEDSTGVPCLSASQPASRGLFLTLPSAHLGILPAGFWSFPLDSYFPMKARDGFMGIP